MTGTDLLALVPSVNEYLTTRLVFPAPLEYTIPAPSLLLTVATSGSFMDQFHPTIPASLSRFKATLAVIACEF